MKNTYQAQLFMLRKSMENCIKEVAKDRGGINLDGESIDIIENGWNETYLRRVILKEINSDGECFTQDGLSFELDELLIEDLAWICSTFNY